MDVQETLATGDERRLLELWNTALTRGTWQEIANEARNGAISSDSERHLQVAEEALAELAEVTALDALAANRRLVDLLTGHRWHVMRQAREEGATWEQIGAALGMSRQGAREWYGKKLARQEQYPGDFHDTDRGRAALED